MVVEFSAALKVDIEQPVWTELRKKLPFCNHPVRVIVQTVRGRSANKSLGKHGVTSFVQKAFRDHYECCKASVTPEGQLGSAGYGQYMDNMSLQHMGWTAGSTQLRDVYATLGGQEMDNVLVDLKEPLYLGSTPLGQDVMMGGKHSYSAPHRDSPLGFRTVVVVLEGRKQFIQWAPSSTIGSNMNCMSAGSIRQLVQELDECNIPYSCVDLRPGQAAVLQCGNVHAAFNLEPTLSLNLSLCTRHEVPALLRAAVVSRNDDADIKMGGGLAELVIAYHGGILSDCMSANALVESLRALIPTHGGVRGDGSEAATARAQLVGALEVAQAARAKLGEWGFVLELMEPAVAQYLTKSMITRCMKEVQDGVVDSKRWARQPSEKWPQPP